MCLKPMLSIHWKPSNAAIDCANAWISGDSFIHVVIMHPSRSLARFACQLEKVSRKQLKYAPKCRSPQEKPQRRANRVKSFQPDRATGLSKQIRQNIQQGFALGGNADCNVNLYAEFSFKETKFQSPVSQIQLGWPQY